MFLHVDMDAFFASIEQMDDPRLKGKPVIVGGQSNRGVVSAASYEARQFGVRSAMPIFEAKKKCPQGIFVAPHRKRYGQISKRIIEILHTFSPLVEQVSIDEAYLDISGCQKLWGQPLTIGKRIKDEIKNIIGLTCSVGIAPVKFLAKIASDYQKPDGLFILEPDHMITFIDKLPIHKVPGVGKNTLQILTKLNISFLGQIRNLPTDLLTQKIGIYGFRLVQLANGKDDSKVISISSPKSISAEETLDKDTKDLTQLSRFLLDQAEEISHRLRKLNMFARTITLKLKYENFKQITRSHTCTNGIATSFDIYNTAKSILEQTRLDQKVRLVGLGASNFISGQGQIQLDLFKQNSCKGSKWKRVDQAMDNIIDKYGKNTVKRANLIEPIIKDKAT